MKAPCGRMNGRFILEDALLGQIFVVCLVMRLKNKDGRKTHYPSRLVFRCVSFKIGKGKGTPYLTSEVPLRSRE